MGLRVAAQLVAPPGPGVRSKRGLIDAILAAAGRPEWRGRVVRHVVHGSPVATMRTVWRLAAPGGPAPRSRADFEGAVGRLLAAADAGAAAGAADAGGAAGSSAGGAAEADGGGSSFPSTQNRCGTDFTGAGFERRSRFTAAGSTRPRSSRGSRPSWRRGGIAAGERNSSPSVRPGSRGRPGAWGRRGLLRKTLAAPRQPQGPRPQAAPQGAAGAFHDGGAARGRPAARVLGKPPDVLRGQRILRSETADGRNARSGSDAIRWIA